MNKLIVRPQWSSDDNGGWFDAIDLGKHISKYFHSILGQENTSKENKASDSGLTCLDQKLLLLIFDMK